MIISTYPLFGFCECLTHTPLILFDILGVVVIKAPPMITPKIPSGIISLVLHVFAPGFLSFRH
jgi:hypothetical protein